MAPEHDANARWHQGTGRTLTHTDIELVTDPATLVDHFSDDPGAHIYALVDTEEPFWNPSRWYRRGRAVVGLVEMPNGDSAAVYAVATRAADETLGLLIDLLDELPAGLLITGPEGLAAAVGAHRPMTWHGPHLRYVLSDEAVAHDPDPAVVPLGPADLDELGELYSTEAGAAFFLPHMLDDHTFVGVRRNGELAAAAGTHVISSSQRVAAIGAVYTHPDHRGLGFGAAVTAGVIHRVRHRTDVIGLNVAEGNTVARSIYERLGFTPVLRYEECELA